MLSLKTDIGILFDEHLIRTYIDRVNDIWSLIYIYFKDQFSLELLVFMVITTHILK